MSRLDYVTIAIVAVCVAALIYLIYMTTNLIGDSGEPETATEATTPAGNEDAGDDTYYFNDEGKVAGDEPGAGTDDASPATSGNTSDYEYQNSQGTDKGGTSSSSSTAAASTPDEMDTSSPAATEEEYTSRSGSTTSSSGSASTASGPYLVIAGTFKEKANAEVMERKLEGLGYSNASLEPFDRGAYTVVLVDRFGSVNDAKALVSELKGKGVEAYVKRN